jgi:hypothetical protein
MERMLFCPACDLYRVAEGTMCPECTKPLDLPLHSELINVAPAANVIRDIKRTAEAHYRISARRRIV